MVSEIERSSYLRAENRLPTQADGAARFAFERAARSGTLRAPPTAAPPEPAEARSGFSSNRKTIDNSPGWRYSSDRKKGCLNFLYRTQEQQEQDMNRIGHLACCILALPLLAGARTEAADGVTDKPSVQPPTTHSPTPSPAVSRPPPTPVVEKQDTARYETWLQAKGKEPTKPREATSLRIGDWGFFDHGSVPGRPLDRAGLNSANPRTSWSNLAFVAFHHSSLPSTGRMQPGESFRGLLTSVDTS